MIDNFTLCIALRFAACFLPKTLVSVFFDSFRKEVNKREAKRSSLLSPKFLFSVCLFQQ